MEAKNQGHNNDDSKNNPSHRDSICLDLMMEILTRLPIKSLLKFQYVSKTWFSIIRSKGFINSSISVSSTVPPQHLIYFNNSKLINETTEKCLFFFTSQEENSSSSTTLVANLDMTINSMEDYYYTRCASINGFFCLSHKDRFMIYNYNTKQVIILPKIIGTIYLGYDPVNDQYKAMCKRFLNHGDNQQHMVLTLGGDKPLSWRHIKGTEQYYTPITKGICINGFVYYGTWTSSTQHPREVIVSFDVRSEKLSFIELPSTITLDWKSNSTLINYKGKLANINFFDWYGKFDLWVLQDAKGHQWSKRECSFELDQWHSLNGVSISIHNTNKMGEIVFSPKFLPHRLQPFYILYYNVENNQYRRVEVKGVAEDEDFRRRYGIENNGNRQLFILPEPGQNFTFL